MCPLYLQSSICLLGISIGYLTYANHGFRDLYQFEQAKTIIVSFMRQS